MKLQKKTSIPASRRPRDDEIDVYGLTHTGRARPNNQDHFLICSLHKRIDVHHTSLPGMDRLPLETGRVAFLSMVADGVGGSARGEEASRIALEAVTQYVAHSMNCYYTADASDDATFHHALEQAAFQVHAEVTRNAAGDPALAGMATTLTLFLGVWPRAYLLQVGDSRYYLFRDGQLMQVTRDQTLAQELVDRGLVRPSDPAHQRFAHMLSSSIGGPHTSPVVTTLQSAWDNVHLMCSDGLTRHISDDRIRDRLALMTSAKQVCEALLQDALDGGGSDNITIIVGRTVPKEDERGRL